MLNATTIRERELTGYRLSLQETSDGKR